ncbi:Camphor resistance CrcB protein [Roseovarius sp. TM1035]|nr:Camphor resistance CrcB protein [Roseovarius sp. TM1035]
MQVWRAERQTRVPRLTIDRARATDAGMMSAFLQVAVGGAIGSCLRYGVVLLAQRLAAPGFPVGVLGVNVIGSFLMGLAVVILAQRGAGQISPLVMTGLLGGFTTFSAFSLEAFMLWERGQAMAALGYVGLSVGLSIGALILGVWLARGFFA